MNEPSQMRKQLNRRKESKTKPNNKIAASKWSYSIPVYTLDSMTACTFIELKANPQLSGIQFKKLIGILKIMKVLAKKTVNKKV